MSGARDDGAMGASSCAHKTSPVAQWTSPLPHCSHRKSLAPRGCEQSRVVWAQPTSPSECHRPSSTSNLTLTCEQPHLAAQQAAPARTSNLTFDTMHLTFSSLSR